MKKKILKFKYVNVVAHKNLKHHNYIGSSSDHRTKTKRSGIWDLGLHIQDTFDLVFHVIFLGLPMQL